MTLLEHLKTWKLERKLEKLLKKLKTGIGEDYIWPSGCPYCDYKFLTVDYTKCPKCGKINPLRDTEIFRRTPHYD